MKIIFVIGRIASGKSHYISSIAQPNDLVVELGDIVRKIKGKVDRTFDISLNKQISQGVIDKINGSNANRAIVASPRSLEVLFDIIDTIHSDDIEFHVMDVPYDICKQRFERAARAKDKNNTYDQSLAGDAIIGMEDLMDWLGCEEGINVQYIANYTPEEFNSSQI